MLRRNWSAGESRVLLLALVIAVASVTTVGFFADRVQAALDRQANELLGGDLVVIADQPVPDGVRGAARARGPHGRAVAHVSRAWWRAGGGVNLAEIKAVTRRLSAARAHPRDRCHRQPGPRSGRAGPKPGTVWIAVALAGRLGVKVGDTLNVGRAQLTVDDDHHARARQRARLFRHRAARAHERRRPRRHGTGPGGQPRDLSPAGERATPMRYSRSAPTMQPKLARGQRIEGVRDARSEVRTALERSQRFLGLASLLSVVLASVAVALAARRFSQRQTDAAAMMRCLGASQADIFAIHALAVRGARARGLRAGTRRRLSAPRRCSRTGSRASSPSACRCPGRCPALRGAVDRLRAAAGLHAAAAAALAQRLDAARAAPRPRAGGAAERSPRSRWASSRSRRSSCGRPAT